MGVKSSSALGGLVGLLWMLRRVGPQAAWVLHGVSRGDAGLDLWLLLTYLAGVWPLADGFSSLQGRPHSR